MLKKVVHEDADENSAQVIANDIVTLQPSLAATDAYVNVTVQEFLDWQKQKRAAQH